MKRCGHCGKPALSTIVCSKHGQKWCMNCGMHDNLPFRKDCGDQRTND